MSDSNDDAPIEEVKTSDTIVVEIPKPINYGKGPPKIIIAGAPASGKGTQCEYIKKMFDVVHLSTGDMLRAAQEAGTPLGIEAKEYMDNGKLVPDSTIIGLVVARLAEADCIEKGWLLDGFPRTGAQADALAAAGVQCDIFILLDVPDELLVERVVGRRSDPVTGKIYHMTYSPPENSEILSRLVQRSDDTEEKVKVRVEAFHNNTNAILEKYASCTYKVDGARKPLTIWYDLRAAISRVIKYDVVLVTSVPGFDSSLLCSNLINNGKASDYVYISAKTITDVTEVAKAMKESGKKKFIIDGLQDIEAFVTFDTIVGNNCNIDYVINIESDNQSTNEELALALQKYSTDTVPFIESMSRLGKLRTFSSDLSIKVLVKTISMLFNALAYIPPYSRTYAMIKPDAVASGNIPEILSAISASNLSVIASKLVNLDDDAINQFYAEHKDRPFFPNLKTFMTSGPALALVLEGTNAVPAWRELAGPTNTQKAIEEAPNSLRAKFGSDGTRNAVHGSDGVNSARREIDFIMKGPGSKCEVGYVDHLTIMTANANLAINSPSSSLFKANINDGSLIEDTYAMIKPLTSTESYDEIIAIIIAHGFEIVKEAKIKFNRLQAESFYGEHKGKEFFDTLISYMTSGPVVALHLRRVSAISAWRFLIGPTNSIKAKVERPDSIRAIFGIDGTRNAVHGSDSTESAAREIAFIFSIGGPLPTPEPTALSPATSPQKLASIPNMRYSTKVHKVPQISRDEIIQMKKFADNDLDPMLQALIQKIMIARPADVMSFTMEQLNNMQNEKIGIIIIIIIIIIIVVIIIIIIII